MTKCIDRNPGGNHNTCRSVDELQHLGKFLNETALSIEGT